MRVGVEPHFAKSLSICAMSCALSIRGISLDTRTTPLPGLRYFVRRWLRHREDLLPPGIVGAHLRGEVVPQFFQRRAECAGITIYVSQTFALILNKSFLLFDRRNRCVLTVLPELGQQCFDEERAGNLNLFAFESGYVANIKAILVDATKKLQQPWQR